VKYQPVLQTAASGEARFDHDPATGESKGLLIEEARTNLVTYSEGTAGWTLYNNGTIQNDVAVAPDGTRAAQVFNYDGASATLRINTAALTNGTTYTMSVYIKSNNSATPSVNLQIGDTTVVSGQALTNEWVRYSGSGTPAQTGYNFLDIEIPSGSDISIWGAQIEVGSFPTSYIPTSGSTVTRSRDLAYINDLRSQSLLNPEDGTFYLEFQTAASDNTLSDSAFAGGIGINSGNYMGVLYASPGVAYLQPTHGQIGANYPSSPPSNGKWKTAVRWTTTSNGETEAQGFLNGGHGDSDTQGGITVFKNATDPDLTIGWVDFSVNSKWGWLRKIALWPSDLGTATLEALTEE